MYIACRYGESTRCHGQKVLALDTLKRHLKRSGCLGLSSTRSDFHKFQFSCDSDATKSKLFFPSHNHLSPLPLAQCVCLPAVPWHRYVPATGFAVVLVAKSKSLRFAALALIHCHYKHSINIIIDRVINLFASRHPRRLSLANILAE